MLLLLGLAAVRLSFVRGIVRTHRIEGSSLAESFLGDHFRAICADCGFTFRCDAEHVPGDMRVVCPNCGYARNELRAEMLQRGERVLVDRWPLAWNVPRRGEVVMAESQDETNMPVVKRVAALPGEKLSIRRGDLYANGRIVRKSLAELQDVAVLVHDNDYQPQKTSNLPSRWHGSAGFGSGWQPASLGFQFEPAQSRTAQLDWLEYQHWPCLSGPSPRTGPSVVLDNDSYNQAASRQLNAVNDVQLRCRIEGRGRGIIALRIGAGKDRFGVILQPRDGLLAVLREDREIERYTLARLRRFEAGDFTLALCDQQLLLAIDDVPLLRLAFLADGKIGEDELHPIAIGAAGMHLKVSHLQVWRDLYHLEPLGTGRTWHAAAPLPAGQIALLGDNPTISTDSRHWPQEGVPLSNVLGKVYHISPFGSTKP